MLAAAAKKCCCEGAGQVQFVVPARAGRETISAEGAATFGGRGRGAGGREEDTRSCCRKCGSVGRVAASFECAVEARAAQ